jgi:hypothetical protein
MHGGSSLRDREHPNYKHGRYSKSKPWWEAKEEARARGVRKLSRVMRAVSRNFEARVERHGEPEGVAWAQVFNSIYGEHFASLERRCQKRRAKRT